MPAHLSPVPAHLSPVPAHLSPVRAHLSPVPAHLSPVPAHTPEAQPCALGAYVCAPEVRAGRAGSGLPARTTPATWT